MAVLKPGQIRLRGASRRFRVVHDRSLTLKETLIRRQRSRYSELWALRDVDLDIAPGEAVGIVGRNGSGKSTLLKMLAGIIPPHTGVVETGGSVASMLELGAGFHPDFTGRENVFMNGAIHGMSERQIAAQLDQIIEFSELPEFIDMPVRTYSSGMQMRLAFAVAAHVNPDILLLDEVLAVGDEAFQRKCMGRIYDFRRGGGTLVFVSHDPNAVEQICDRAILIDRGRVVQDDRPSRVMETYHRLLAESTNAIGAEIGDSAETADGQPESPSSLGGWGTGDAAIEAVRLLGHDGPSSSFVSGDAMSIEMTVRTKSPIAAPNFGVSITTGEGTLLFGTNTHITDVTIGDLSAVNRIVFAIPALPLHEGAFVVNCAIVSQDEKTVYHWLDRASEFTVFGRIPGIGLTALDGTWAIAENDDVRPGSPD